ncbi:polysaccharide biosynthesis tyrosine autokinase [Halomonas sp. KM-1]|uniref:polysaccharide biosynthesis tyrosine autokinase n=1 Tax=Halomonas sp. KM-1 TaxID=590061 RepID=UPI00028872F0|nr:polysaccharide biosynthesis tyrosine autokinase [Halomonas sp. KM-1]
MTKYQANIPMMPKPEEIDLRDIFDMLMAQKWKIIVITLLFCFMGVSYALTATPIYRTDALVQVEPNGPSVNPLQDIRSLTREATQFQSEISILRSRLVLGQTVDRRNLEILLEPRKVPLIGNFLLRRGIERPDFALNWPYVFANEYISLSEINVGFEYLGETFILKVMDEMSYSIYLKGNSLGKGEVGQVETFLEGELILNVGEFQAVPGAEFKFTKFSRMVAIDILRQRYSVHEEGADSGILRLAVTGSDPIEARNVLEAITHIYLEQNIQRQSAEAEKSLEFIQNQLPDIHDRLIGAEDSLNSYRNQRESVDLTLETQGLLERLVEVDTQVSELELSQADISRRFTPSHPTYAALLDKLGRLQNERRRLEVRIDALPETQQQVLRMARDVEVNQQVYVQMLNKAQEMSIAKASTVGNVRILDTAGIHPHPIKPRKAMVVGLATALGLIISISIVLLRGLLNRGVENIQQLAGIGLPAYATVPLSEEQVKLARMSNTKRNQLGWVLAYANTTDIAIESLRSLRTNLHFAMLEAPNNRIMITGPSPGIGKSFVAVNLAAVCAQAGQRILVIDADVRKGQIHNLFCGKREEGLSELISGKVDIDKAIRSTHLDGLDYIGRGITPPNPSELLMQEGFTKTLEFASKRYDLVIIDVPPIMAVTDAAIVGKQVGTTLMTVRYGVNTLAEIDLAKLRLESAGCLVKGSVLNAIERRASSIYGYYHYSYS